MSRNYEANVDAHDIVRFHKGVLDSLLETQPCLLLVLKRTDVEGECTSSLLDFREDSTRGLHLQLVGHR